MKAAAVGCCSWVHLFCWLIVLYHQVFGAIASPSSSGDHSYNSNQCQYNTIGQIHEIHEGWKACRVTDDGSNPINGCLASQELRVPTLPTTALLVLLENQLIPAGVKQNITQHNIYFSTNLGLLDDIESVGRDFYTLLYELEMPSLVNSSCYYAGFESRQTLRIAGINYRATAYLDGEVLEEVNRHENFDGMFRRRSYHVTAGSRFNLLIEPPLNPGSPNCTAIGCSGQGGDHALAKDGATAQFMLGWDWCQAMPDRATGFYGSVTLEHTGLVAIIDPTVQTLSIECDDPTGCTKVVLRFLVHLEYVGPNCTSSAEGVVTITADWGESWTVPYSSHSSELDIVSGDIIVKHPALVQLWWPHGVGRGETPKLHSFIFSVDQSGELSDKKEIQVGIRTISTYLDQRLQGQTFEINGKRIYLLGGNWISTDQALRFSASKERYCDEIALHKQAGLNLIRVWAGGTAERDQFYDCADRLGILVFQEFWMSGDNNGRWEGNYSWPLNYGTYIANVRDTVQRLRRHASLLFYGGCNECLAPKHNPWFPNPPAEIDHSIRLLVEKLDPGRFYIPSSMGGPNVADAFKDPSLWNDRNYSLSYADGPYSMQLPATFFERNPGLQFKNVSIGFQPEIGSTSASTYQGLLRFMSIKEANEGVPGANGEAGEAWNYHKYISWSTNQTYDHIYAYIGSNKTINASEWCAAAQLASHVQYQQLFNGYISFIFEYTSAVILWKSQSPWPAMRGFLYDWYLESTGTLRGIQAALGAPVSVVLDSSTWHLRLINRQVDPLIKGTALGANYSWINLQGEILVTENILLVADRVAPMSAVTLTEEGLKWPDACSSVCFLRLQVEGPTMDDTNLAWYWLTNPAIGNASDYSSLGKMRSEQMGDVFVKVHSCDVGIEATLTLQLEIAVPSKATEVIFYPTFSLYWEDDEPIFPIFNNLEAQVVVLPGEIQRRRLTSSTRKNPSKSRIRMKMATWNAPTTVIVVECNDASIGVTKPYSDTSMM